MVKIGRIDKPRRRQRKGKDYRSPSMDDNTDRPPGSSLDGSKWHGERWGRGVARQRHEWWIPSSKSASASNISDESSPQDALESGCGYRLSTHLRLHYWHRYKACVFLLHKLFEAVGQYKV